MIIDIAPTIRVWYPVFEAKVQEIKPAGHNIVQGIVKADILHIVLVCGLFLTNIATANVDGHFAASCAQNKNLATWLNHDQCPFCDHVSLSAVNLTFKHKQGFKLNLQMV
jgi:hypothetical protein